MWLTAILVQGALLVRFLHPSLDQAWFLLPLGLAAMVPRLPRRLLQAAAVLGALGALGAALGAREDLHRAWQTYLRADEAFGHFSNLWILAAGTAMLALRLAGRSRKERPWFQASLGLLGVLAPWYLMTEAPAFLGGLVPAFLGLMVDRARLREPDRPWHRHLLAQAAWVGLAGLAGLGLALVMPVSPPPLGLHRLLATWTGAGGPAIGGGAGSFGLQAQGLAFNQPPPLGEQPLFRVQGRPGDTVYLASRTLSGLDARGWVPDRGGAALVAEAGSVPPDQGTLATLNFLGDMLPVLPVLPGAPLVRGPGERVWLTTGVEGREGLSHALDLPLKSGSRLEYRRTGEAALLPRPMAVNRSLPDGLRALLEPLALPLRAVEDPEARVRALLGTLEGATYDTEVRFSGSLEDQVASFLELRSGYCTQFASTAAMLARAVGIPSRLVEGYAVALPQDRPEALVREQNAHAWVEVWFEDRGWILVDPTPGAWKELVVPPEAPAQRGGRFEEAEAPARAPGTLPGLLGALALVVALALGFLGRELRRRWVLRRYGLGGAEDPALAWALARLYHRTRWPGGQAGGPAWEAWLGQALAGRWPALYRAHDAERELWLYAAPGRADRGRLARVSGLLYAALGRKVRRKAPGKSLG